MDATTETTSVERELAIAASPETVWQFLVDEEKSSLTETERRCASSTATSRTRRPPSRTRTGGTTTSSGWRSSGPAATPAPTRGSPGRCEREQVRAAARRGRTSTVRAWRRRR